MDYMDKIKKLRLEHNLTQTELSLKLGLSKSAYGLYETRKRQMDIETFIQICKIFNVSSEELLNI